MRRAALALSALLLTAAVAKLAFAAMDMGIGMGIPNIRNGGAFIAEPSLTADDGSTGLTADDGSTLLGAR